jgi:hypothetical protein
MTERDWEMFFDLLQKIVDLPNKTWQDKADQVNEEAARYDAEVDLAEFTGWFE